MRFRNINIRSENGIFISGIGHPDVAIMDKDGDLATHNNVYNIEFNDVSMVLDKWYLYEHPSIDYRPSYGIYGVVIPSLVNGLRIEYSNNITINNFEVTFFGMDYQWYWSECYDVETDNTNNIVFHDFTCNSNKTVNIVHEEL